MRIGVMTGAGAVLLGGPFVLAFFSGGYFDEPRAWAGLGAWTLVALAAGLAPRPLPRARWAVIAIVSLALLASMTVLSLAWSPLAGAAFHDAQRLFLYLGALVAAAALLRGRALGMLEPSLVGGVLVVICYGLSERLLPSVVTLSHSPNVGGRLEQPLTYWNATGALAALGLVLCARIAGDRLRPERLRLPAAAAAAPIGLGLFLTVSRGALFACLAGLLTLVIANPDRPQLRAVLLTVAAGLASSLCAAPLAGVTGLTGAHGTRITEGAVTLAALVTVALGASVAQRWIARRELTGRLSTGSLRLPRRAPMAAVALVLAAFAAFLAVGARETGHTQLGPGASRLQTLQSNRYEYWRVSARAFASEPVRGIGSGGFAVYWLRHRPFSEGARDAHSLYFQTAAELGLIGLVLLASMMGAVALCAREAHRRTPTLAAGALAGVSVWAAHVAVDWDWQMPSATLPAVLLAGALLGLADRGPASEFQPRPSRQRRAQRRPGGQREHRA